MWINQSGHGSVIEKGQHLWVDARSFVQVSFPMHAVWFLPKQAYDARYGVTNAGCLLSTPAHTRTLAAYETTVRPYCLDRFMIRKSHICCQAVCTSHATLSVCSRRMHSGYNVQQRRMDTVSLQCAAAAHDVSPQLHSQGLRSGSQDAMLAAIKQLAYAAALIAVRCRSFATLSTFPLLASNL